MNDIEVLGCLIRYNKILEETGMPYSIECTLEGTISEPKDVENLFEIAINEYLNIILTKTILDHKTGWEYIGKLYNLYKKHLLSVDGGRAGEIRVVEAGGKPLSLTGVLNSKAILDDLQETLKKKFELRIGKPMEVWEALRKPYSTAEPKGQTWINNPVIYDALEEIPKITVEDTEGWTLKVKGKTTRTYVLEELKERAGETEGILHCVAGWSAKYGVWLTLPLRNILAETGIPGNAKWLTLKSRRGFSTVLPIDVISKEDPMIAFPTSENNVKTERGHPLRLLSSKLYGWKQVKWLQTIALETNYYDGYWEARGYHEIGRVDYNERFKIRNKQILEEGIPGKNEPKPPKRER